MTRYLIVSESPSLIIKLPAPMKLHIIAFLCVWLTGWTFGEAHFIQITLTSSDRRLWIGLVLWGIVGVLCFTFLMWQLVGKEIITCDKEFLEIKNQIFGISFTRKCRLSKITAFEVDWEAINLFDPRRKMELAGIGGGKIKFKYGRYIQRCGIGVTEVEAEQVIDKIQDFIEKQARGYLS